MKQFRALTADDIECRVSTVSDKGCSLLLYKDARCDMKILDETVFPENWKRSHELINGNLFATYPSGTKVRKNGLPSRMSVRNLTPKKRRDRLRTHLSVPALTGASVESFTQHRSSGLSQETLHWLRRTANPPHTINSALSRLSLKMGK